MFDTTATFGDEGEGRLKVKGQERGLWQVRRMALEELLFRGFWFVVPSLSPAIFALQDLTRFRSMSLMAILNN
jgi:hypothetical protein